jgi:hypothetical protein
MQFRPGRAILVLQWFSRNGQCIRDQLPVGRYDCRLDALQTRYVLGREEPVVGVDKIPGNQGHQQDQNHMARVSHRGGLDFGS